MAYVRKEAHNGVCVGASVLINSFSKQAGRPWKTREMSERVPKMWSKGKKKKRQARM